MTNNIHNSEQLSTLNIAALRAIAKGLSVKRYSKLHKSELINAIITAEATAEAEAEAEATAEAEAEAEATAEATAEAEAEAEATAEATAEAEAEADATQRILNRCHVWDYAALSSIDARALYSFLHGLSMADVDKLTDSVGVGGGRCDLHVSLWSNGTRVLSYPVACTYTRVSLAPLHVGMADEYDYYAHVTKNISTAISKGTATRVRDTEGNIHVLRVDSNGHYVPLKTGLKQVLSHAADSIRTSGFRAMFDAQRKSLRGLTYNVKVEPDLIWS